MFLQLKNVFISLTNYIENWRRSRDFHESEISCLIVEPVVSYPTSPGLYKRNLKTLKALAQQLNVPVILISLTSKAAEKRVNSEWQHPAKQKPIVEDICFSSIVKEYVDVVLLMDRRIYSTTGSYVLKDKAEFTVYRNGKRLGRTIQSNFISDFLKSSNVISKVFFEDFLQQFFFIFNFSIFRTLRSKD